MAGLKVRPATCPTAEGGRWQIRPYRGGVVVADVVIPVADDATHAARVTTFQNAVREHAGRTEGRLAIVRQFITTGMPVGLIPEAYYHLRSEVAAYCKVHPSAVVVVGSCRTGFSIAKKEFRPRYRPFNEESDIDVAVVSAPMFDTIWDTVFASQSSPDWVLSAIGAKRGRGEYPHHLARDLFNGCIVPERLNAIRPTSVAADWVAEFDRITRTRAYGKLGVRGRLYRSWSRLESYQGIMVTECNAALSSQPK